MCTFIGIMSVQPLTGLRRVKAMKRVLASLLILLFVGSSLVIAEKPEGKPDKPGVARPERKRERPSPEKMKEMLMKRLEESFVKADTDKDGKLSKEEFIKFNMDRFKAMRERFSKGRPGRPEKGDKEGEGKRPPHRRHRPPKGGEK